MIDPNNIIDEDAPRLPSIPLCRDCGDDMLCCNCGDGKETGYETLDEIPN